MPCSGLKSATSVTPRARAQEQIDRRRAVARAAGVVGDEPDALALSGAKPSARSTSMPVCTGAAGRVAGALPDGPKSCPLSPRARAASERHVGEGGGRDRGDLRAERRHVALAVRMDAVRQEDDELARDRIDPD